MSSVAVAVVGALKETPKGRLSYASPLDSCHSSTEKLRVLNELTLPPSLSPGALQYIAERTEKLALAVEPSNDTSDSICDTTGIPLIPTPSTTTPSHHHTLTSSTYNNREVSMATADSSVIGQICCELDECEQSLDDRMMREASVSVAFRRHHFREQLEGLRQERTQQYKQERAARKRRGELEQARAEAEELQQRQAVDLMIKKVAEEYRLHAEMLEAKLRTGEEQKMELLKIEERRRKAAERLVEQCRKQREEALELFRKFAGLFGSCRHPQLLPRSVVESYQAAVERVRAIDKELLTQEHSRAPDQAKVDILQAVLTGHLPLLAELKMAVEEANQRAEREEREKNEEILRQTAERLKQEQQQQAKLEEQAKQEEEKKVSTAAVPPTRAVNNSASELGMPQSIIEVYGRLQEGLENAVKSCESLNDPQAKKYRFDLQKAVSTPVNAISAQSGEHLYDKIMRLRKLLSGQPVQVAGKTLTINSHPAARLYCVNLLAKKIVKQGEDQVASQSDAAFATAAVAVAIWSEFPELGDLILGHFHTTCPLLVPFYPHKEDSMSEAEHMRLQGYRVSEKGSVESEDIFLKRMSGVVRLYAAIIQTPPFHSGQPHPHGPEHGWAWLARVLNMPPHPTLTATALYDFLETAGHTLMQKYNKQFKKLLFVLCKEYVHQIDKVTPQTQQGPLSRLKQFLEECIAAGRIPPPKGRLTPQFWRTRSEGIATA